MSAASAALTTLEVAVARRSAALPRGKGVGVHAQAHGAPRVAPLGARSGEDAVEALPLGLLLDEHRTWYDEHPDPRRHATPFEDGGGSTQVLHPTVGAGAEEHGVDGDLAH